MTISQTVVDLREAELKPLMLKDNENTFMLHTQFSELSLILDTNSLKKLKELINALPIE